jgi:DNA-binding GntR family transcriptional regulator
MLEHLPEEHSKDDFDKMNQRLTIKKHREMFEAIKSGDKQRAELLFREHTHDQVRNLENIMAYYGHLDINEL